MSFERSTLERIDALYDAGRDFVENPQLHGGAIEYRFDSCRFDAWRRRVNDLLHSLGGCEDMFYQRFSKEVTRPDVRNLEEGLRILAAVRDDLGCELRRQTKPAKVGQKVSCGRLSASYH